jgi:hypothetical protein
MTQELTKEEFEALPPLTRGYATYMLGARDDQPHVPDERNPYLEGTSEHDHWTLGAERASIEAQEGDD